VFRYIYINIYALLLLLIGAGHILIILFTKPHWGVTTILAIVAVYCIYYGINILLSWPAKMREYRILIERNTPTFNSESFRPYMQAPCGRQLTKVVLKDLSAKSRYRELKQMQEPLLRLIIKGCKHEPARITIYDDSKDSKQFDE
jgi:hypothetical protein